MNRTSILIPIVLSSLVPPVVTVSEDKFCELATIQNSFHDVCYDDVHMYVRVCMDTHVYMHIYMHLCASTPCMFVYASWLYLYVCVFIPTVTSIDGY